MNTPVVFDEYLKFGILKRSMQSLRLTFQLSSPVASDRFDSLFTSQIL